MINRLFISFALSSFAFSQNSIIAAEYFFGTDPGKGNGISIEAKDGAFDTSEESISLDIKTDSLRYGYHTVFIRFQSSDGKWGNLKSQSFTVSNPSVSKIKEAVYFIAHYDESGKLEEVSSPVPVKFMGEDDNIMD